MDSRQSQAGPLADVLGVKKGSNKRACTSGVMPVPVSDTVSATYCPGFTARCVFA
jgi:hypothetical protein